MIVTITGLPGNGKTLYALNYVKAWAERESRQVWYHGINGLKLDWKRVPVESEHLDGEKNPPTDVPQWWLLPAKSIVVIDEAQNCGFAPRQRGQVPEWARKLETHRHLGVDIVFITQDPSLLDSHDRRLSELHFHVKRTFGLQRAVVHEFRPVRDNVSKSTKGSIEHRWSFPKNSYEWYHSAEAHTHKVRVPMKVWVFLALPFVIGALSWFAWVRYLDPHRKQVPVTAPASMSGLAAAPSGSPRAVLDAVGYTKQYAPRVAGLAYTAPVYDDVTKPVEAPFPAACVQSKSRCQCYTQQGTRLDTTRDLCESITAGGFFVSWARPVAQAVPVRLDTVPAAPVPAGPWHVSLGGTPNATLQPLQDQAPSQQARQGQARAVGATR